MKKKWIFVVVALVLIGGLVGWFVGQDKSDPYNLDGTQNTSPAPELKYILVAEAEGLEVEPRVVIEDWKQGVLSATVEIRNTRNETLLTAKLNVYMNQSEWISSSFSVKQLKPGETTTLNLPWLEVANVSSIKSVEFSFDSGSIIWEESVSAPAPTEEPKPTEQPTEPEIPTYTAVDYPKDPQSPEGVTAAFFFYFNEKEYAKAEELLSREFTQVVREAGGLEVLYNEAFRGHQLEKIKIEETGEHKSGARSSPQIGYFHVFLELHFKNGGSERVKTELIQESNNWKIDFIDFRDR